MGKKDKPVKPYTIDLEINLEGLEGVPKETNACEITRNWMVKAVLAQGEVSRGYTIQNQRQLKRIRDILEEAIKTKAKTATFEIEDWRFFKKAWDSASLPPSANEVICRIDDKIREAVSKHDREDVEINEEVESTQKG